MWLKDDLEQFKQNWKQSPWWVRLWMVVSLFLAVSSFASLAETFANWKGFFLDAIEFYRSWISGPLRDFAAAYGLRYTSQRADYLVLYAIVMSTCIRALAIDMDWSNRVEKRSFWLMVSFLIGTLCYAAYVSVNTSHPLPARAVLITYAGFFFLSAIWAKQAKFARLILIQAGLLIVVVGVLGAISTGLSASP
jgi:hypothetical protein